MKFSEQWLREYVNPTLDTEGLAHELTMAGLEVEAIEPVAASFSGVVVARVCALAPHPDADRLRVCQVDAGTKDLLQIVCGATNVCVDARVPCALPGAELPGGAIRATKLRGVASAGMLCSAAELGVADGIDGLLILPEDAPVGMNVRQYLHLDDQMLTLKLTPNRSDCLSVRGIAREVAALMDLPLTLPESLPLVEQGEAGLEILLSAPEACPRYCAQRVEGLNPAARTPEWMRERLLRSGVRPLSAIVDVTNYVMLELGQPLHAFDADTLRGAVQVRWAYAQEKLCLLNGQQVTLDTDMLVIADENGALAVAGVMGGQRSAVGEETVNIMLESAFFHPDALAGRARRLSLATDAAYRFERGVDFSATRSALARATSLLIAICGGVARPAVELQHDLPQRLPIFLRPDRVKRLLGVPIASVDMATMLRRLGFMVRSLDAGDGLEVVAPAWRFDVALEVDLVEEIARLYGYDNIAPIAPQATMHLLPNHEAVRGVDAVRNLMSARGYQEVMTWSFVDPAWEFELAPHAQRIALQNPIAAQMAVMRSTLWGGLLDVLDSNLKRGQTQVRILELGRCYVSSGDGFDEPHRIAGLVYGPVWPEQWGQVARTVDFFDVKACVEALFWPCECRIVSAQHSALHPGQSGQIMVNDRPVGWMGVLHPALVQRRQWSSAPVLFEIDLDVVLQRRVPMNQPMSRFQAVRRDLAVVVDAAVPMQNLLDTMRAAKVSYVTDIVLFDNYRGKHIDSDKKSLAFGVVMQDNHKTLTDNDADATLAQLADLLQQRFGAQLRS